MSRLQVAIYCFFGAFLLLCSSVSKAQGGPPYYTNDPGTPGTNNWEINLGYMPFLYADSSASHVPDIDINFGLGERIQLTYESAWLRVRKGTNPAVYGMEQSNPGLKWRFYENKEEGFEISIFPQGFINNPNHAVERGISPPGSSFEMPIEFTKKLGPVDVNWEVAYSDVLVNGQFGTGLEFKGPAEDLAITAAATAIEFPHERSRPPTQMIS